MSRGAIGILRGIVSLSLAAEEERCLDNAKAGRQA
jgi:hypothetical protein